MKKLIILSGPPGAGKSKFIEDTISKAKGTVTLSPDAIREENGFYVRDEDGNIIAIDQSHNNEVFDIYYKRINECMDKGDNIALDATHTSLWSVKKALALAEEYGYTDIEFHRFECPLDVLKARNEKSARGYKSVPEDVVENMYNNNQKFKDEDLRAYVSENYPDMKLNIIHHEYDKTQEIIRACKVADIDMPPEKVEQITGIVGVDASSTDVVNAILESYAGKEKDEIVHKEMEDVAATDAPADGASI